MLIWTERNSGSGLSVDQILPKCFEDINLGVGWETSELLAHKLQNVFCIYFFDFEFSEVYLRTRKKSKLKIQKARKR